MLPISISEDLNNNNPLPIDVVVACDVAFSTQLDRLNSRTWFQKKARFVDQQGENLEIYAYEWTPGQDIDSIEVSVHEKCLVFIFAEYFNGKNQTARFAGDAVIRVSLGKDGLEIIEVSEN